MFLTLFINLMCSLLFLSTSILQKAKLPKHLSNFYKSNKSKLWDVLTVSQMCKVFSD